MTAQRKPHTARVLSIMDAQKRTESDVKVTGNDVMITEIVTDDYEASAQKVTGSVLAIATPFDADADEAVYSWKSIQETLGLRSNTHYSRWFPEKLMPLFAALDAPALLNGKGKPTKFAAVWLSRYKLYVVDNAGDFDEFAAQVRAAFAPKPSEVPVEIMPFGGDPAPGPGSAITPVGQQGLSVSNRAETLMEKLMLAKQAKQEREALEAKLAELDRQEREQKILEKVLDQYTAEELRKKEDREMELRFRQMLENGEL